jgi:5,10-methylenetetrahydrofolate reductase
MVHGPCGGVRPDLSCELGDRPCPFVTRPRLRWDGEPVAAVPVDVPLVLTDLTVRPYDPASVRRVVRILAPVSDGLLVGEHHNRPDLPPTLFATEVLAAGGRPWTTLTCRDRNRIVLEQELRGLLHIGVDAVLCVTGDGRAYDVRTDVTQVFDLDGPRLAELAASVGLSAAVAETPLAPPTALRPQRLVVKQRSGAGVAVLNHVPRAADVATFVTAARAAGLTIPVIASVPIYTDEHSAAVLRGLPGLELDEHEVRQVLTATDPVAAGIEAAVGHARELLAIDGVSGVNLSGAASARGWDFAARVKADVGTRVLEGTAA